MILIFRLGTCVTSGVTGSTSVSASHLRNAGCPAQKCQVRISMQSIHSRPLRKRLGDSRRPATCRCPGGQPWLCDAIRGAPGHADAGPAARACAAAGLGRCLGSGTLKSSCVIQMHCQG